MKTGKSDMEHSSDVMMQIFDRLSKRFMKYEYNNDDSIITIDYLTKLSGSIGYSAQINGAITKLVKLEKRLSIIEERLKNQPLFNMSIFESEPLEQYK